MAELAEPAWAARALAGEDADAMRTLFAEVFGKPMSKEFWNWKYAHPAGHGVGVWKGAEMVAHYGGIGRDILYFGKPERAVQITDVMVKTAGRNAVRRNSPFYLAGKAFLESWIGYGQPYLLGFGFPSDRHMALARHLGLYAPVGRMVETRWETAGTRPSPWTSIGEPLARLAIPRHLDKAPDSPPTPSFPAIARQPGKTPLGPTTPSFPGLTGESSSTAIRKRADILDALWQSQAGDLSSYIVATRPPAFLAHRYLSHPDHRYDLHLVRHRFTRRPLGLIVLRHLEDHSLLMDVVAPLNNFPLLLRAAIARSADAGKPLLKTWCSRPFAPLFEHHGATQEDLPITTPTNILTPAPAPEALRDRWWLMPGDTDFL